VFAVAPAYAQPLNVSGRITDEAGQPVVGATVMVKGTTIGAMTGINGDYDLAGVDANATLVFSFVGFGTVEELVNGRARIDVQMGTSTQDIEEVLVIGHGTVKKGDLTGAVTAVSADKLQKGLATSATDLLVGKIAGVNVTTNSGEPGSGAQIRIRGGSSLSASNDPLFVIDGLAIDNEGIKGVANPLAMINPADIETFTVLKDASATAIYGSRASNGVIIITTKKGRVGGGKPTITYNGNVSVSTLTKRMEVLTGDKLRAYVGKLEMSDDQLAYLGNANSDWQKQIYRPAFGTDHNVSIAGAVKELPYRASVGYTNQNGIIKTSNMERYTAALNLNPSFLDKHLTVNASGKAMYIKSRYADSDVVGAALSFDPTNPVFSDDPELQNFYGGYYQRLAEGKSLNDAAWTTTWNNQTSANPLATLEQKKDEAKSYDLIGNVEVDYKIHGFEDLRLHVNVGGDYASGKQTTVISPYSAQNHYYGWDGFETKDKYNALFNAYAQYNNDFSIHHVDAMVGYEWQHFHDQTETGGSGFYQSTNNDPALAGQPYNKQSNKTASESFLVSFFGRVNYSLLDRYLFTFTLRDDGSSRFGPDHRWGLFPSMALSWKLKEEAFLKDVNALSALSLRLGYGKTGQQSINQDDYLYLSTYTVSREHAKYPVGDGGAYIDMNRPGAIYPDLTWETTTTYNVGVDYGFLNGRITGALDYYYRVTNDLINEVDVPAGANFRNRVITNIGSLVNSGVELSVSARALQTADYSWDLGLNVTHNRNKITALNTGVGDSYYIPTGGISSGTGNNIQANKVGSAANSFFAYETKQGADGKYYFVDRYEDGQINASDLRIYRHAAPDYMLNLTSRFAYKNWDFGISLRANIGNYVYNDVLASNIQNVTRSNIFSTKIGGYQNILQSAYDAYWGDNFKYDDFSDWYLSDYFIENASFLRCDNITVGYTFNTIASWKSNLRVYATVQNPFVISGYKGLDPELRDGIDNNIYPRSMITLVGVSFSF
jgi:iron complex outermembrane receptor protein